MSGMDFLRGAYCPLIVPFRDGRIDFDSWLGALGANEHRSPLVPASPEVERQLDKVLAEIGLV